MKSAYREAIKGLNDHTDTLKLIHKEHKSTEKEAQVGMHIIQKRRGMKL